MAELQLNPARTALVVIDLQKGIAAMPCAPYPATAVVERAARLADAFRKAGGLVVLVNVNTTDGKDMLRPVTDEPVRSVGWERPADWAQLVPELNVAATDHLVTKRQWGAFFGTDLDLQLRRRGIDTIVLCGIATHIGVETTAREAYQHAYQQVFAEDAMTAMDAAQHENSCKYIFPRVGRLRKTDEIIAALRG